jgi:beta-phosphoglucomutase-like phosphatase (HAD superfamily)
MLFSGYIFDVEGTLVDSVRQNLLSLQESLANFGATVPYDLLQLYSGLDGDQTLQLVVAGFGPGRAQAGLGRPRKTLPDEAPGKRESVSPACARCSRR